MGVPLDNLENFFPLVDHVQALDDLQIGSFFFIIFRSLSIFVEHFQALSSLFVHEGLTEALICLLVFLSAEIALPGLLEHQEIVKNECSFLEFSIGKDFLSL